MSCACCSMIVANVTNLKRLIGDLSKTPHLFERELKYIIKVSEI